MVLTVILVAVAALAVGLLAGWLAMRQRNGRMLGELGAVGKEVEMVRQQAEEQRNVVAQQRNEMERMQRERGDLQAEAEGTARELAMSKEKVAEREATIEECRSQIGKLREQLAEQVGLVAATTAERDTARREAALLKEQMTKEEKVRSEAFDRQLKMAQEELKNETRQLLEQRAEALGKSNDEHMGHVVKPLKEQLEAMQKQVNESLKTSTDNRASIEKAIENLVRRTEEIGNDANNLARALKGENKTQGNWGEMVLDTILENSGLIKGEHYETQVTLRDETGRAIVGEESGHRMVPDVIVHYPDGKDVIVDSKVSLTAYLDYCNAETEEEREAAAQRHVVSVRQHVRELRSKNYAAYIKPPRQALQYMVMFIPNEMAMQLALQTDRTLWREAFEGGICITSEQNLIVLLRMIQLAWTQVQQFQNQQEIMSQAKTLLDRVALFVERFNKIDGDINDLRRDFEEAGRTLTGRQSIIGAAKAMEKLGAKKSAQRSLPEITED